MGEPADVQDELAKIDPVLMVSVREVCDCMPLCHFTLVGDRRRQRKEHTVYTKEQKLLLQEHFDQCMYPRLKERLELALEIGVTKYEIKTWFKNHHAKYKQKNMQKIQERLPESSGSSKAAPGSTYSCGHLSVVASANTESMSPGTATVGSIPQVNPSWILHIWVID
ncbi:Homeobox protein DLX-3 [Microtus ochrogaster]|uniref:Homeobox protein DLX-3 n=1 Tax=Microtus ochrogaster TaxID=79684 RepID=A0A8J6FWV7_MICOH|nr:Homeobox protein DLX-3 [Microtus ochrogaster]